MKPPTRIRPPLAEHFFIAGLETSALINFNGPIVPISTTGLASALSSTSLSSGIGGSHSARGSVRLSTGSMRISMNTTGSSNPVNDIIPSPGGGMLLDVKIEEENEPEEKERVKPELYRSKSSNHSARSSATITATGLSVNTSSQPYFNPAATTPTSVTELSSFAAAVNAVANHDDDDDFEETLRRFAEERDSFLDTQFGAPTGNSLAAPGTNNNSFNRNSTLSISSRRLSGWRRRAADEVGGSPVGATSNNGVNTAIQPSTSGPIPSSTNVTAPSTTGHNNLAPGLRPGGGAAGSLRRKISTMSSSLKRNSSIARQPSVGRQSSVRTARRVSGYNSVIPTPAPFRPDPAMHPLARRYEPVLLDRYPREKEASSVDGRCPFPDYVPMFAFPNDITVLSADCRPRPVWHAFAMTGAHGIIIHGVCVTMWIGVDSRRANELEAQCERWRIANMSAAEREFANSLGERLVTERAKLSNLLARLAVLPTGSTEWEDVQIVANSVEEKIELISQVLRPVRHGAAAKIEGLTDGESGLWIPRAYGIIGRDGEMLPVWKEWLKAVTVPMQAVAGALTGVPASCHRTGVWRPLEHYVKNLIQIPSPGPGEQAEINVRELRMFARHSGLKELPGHRSTDLFPLFRCLSVANVVLLFEAVLAEMRIVLLSSHPAMLYSTTSAIQSLLFPLEWAGISIPLLPARLIQALEAPCPYIIGVDRRYDNITLPEDDFILVDLDADSIECTANPAPPTLPRTQRRKLVSLLQLAACHSSRFRVPVGTPSYVTEAFPSGRFSSEFGDVYSEKVPSQPVSTLAGLSSSVFTCNSSNIPKLGQIVGPVADVFAKARIETEQSSLPGSADYDDRRSLGSPNSLATSPVSRSDSGFALHPALREKRSEQFELGRRSLSFGDTLRRLQSGSNGMNGINSVADGSSSIKGRGLGLGHFSAGSTSTLVPGQYQSMSQSYSPSISGQSVYSPSIYAPSSYAPSTILPMFETEMNGSESGREVIEGHILERRSSLLSPPLRLAPSTSLAALGRVPSLGRKERERSYRGSPSLSSVSHHPRIPSTASTIVPAPPAVTGSCQVCGLTGEAEDLLFCKSCPLTVHDRCVSSISTVCSSAFKQVLVRAAFLRCFASLLYTYRRSLRPVDNSAAAKSAKQKSVDPTQIDDTLKMHFDAQSFISSVPSEQRPFVEGLTKSQAFYHFLDQCERPDNRHTDRERQSPAFIGQDRIAVFDQAVIAKRNRGRGVGISLGFGFGKRASSKLSEVEEWQSVGARNDSKTNVTADNDTSRRGDADDWDYLEVISRTPARLESRFLNK